MKQFVAVIAVGLMACGTLLAGCTSGSVPAVPAIDVILTGLNNPRGVAFGPAGELFVVEAGTGRSSVDPTQMTGSLTKFSDLNKDGDFDDEGEAERLFSHLPTYNALYVFGTGRDEVNGPGDVIVHDDGRLFLSVDGGFDAIALFEISSEGRIGRTLADRGNMNSIGFDLAREKIFAVESGLNQLIEVALQGELREIVAFPPLASGQQAVPAGLAIDAQSGDVLVALFSGAALDAVTGDLVAFVPGDATVVRVDTQTGQTEDEITGLTTVVDVAIDASGNVFVVEMATASTELLPKSFDLFDPQAPLVSGGYERFTGRVTLYPADGSLPRILADGLDTPTNITIGPDGALYISTGQGTPGRRIPSPAGTMTIVGEIIRISDYLSE